jgi:hypothetical protein
MLYFTTLFDSFYLSRGLLMHESLLRYCKDFHLYIFAFDDVSYNILNALNPEKTTIIPLNEFETRELLEVKKTRTIAEYCWTCTPSTILYVLERYKVLHCTYIDADIYFYSDPSTLISEMTYNNKTVLITEHRFSLLPKIYEEKRGGRFCVQFVTFMNETESLNVLKKWKGQCIEWCFARYEDGKFGDQKYLEEWPELYANIHILQHQGGGLAPWNITQYRFEDDGDDFQGTVRKTGEHFRPVFFHFQYVKQIAYSVFDIGWYLIRHDIINIFYLPYLKRVIQITNKLSNNFNFHLQFVVLKHNSVKEFLKNYFKRFTGYNIIKINNKDGLYNRSRDTYR